ncbi:MAG TPA: hypothetical protein VNO17_01120 [Actinomycetota bacterium]|nr:hypothetical protein [Actinomycetota bacterium]
MGDEQVLARGQCVHDREDPSPQVLGRLPAGGAEPVEREEARPRPGVEVEHAIGQGRGAYVYLIEGRATFDEEPVSTGDAAKVTEQPSLRIRAGDTSELILVDVPMAFTPVGVWAGRI